MSPNRTFPRYSVNTCRLMGIPVWWAGVPMNEVRLRTIWSNLRRVP